MADTVHELGTTNLVVILAYLAFILCIGVWTSRNIKNSNGFFTAGGRMNAVVVGLSILATYLSALTMMALSGIAFGAHDLTWTVQLPFLCLTAFIITRYVLPKYREAGVISVYQYLEEKIHVSSRLLASASFIIYSIGRMGLVLFLPALAFAAITGIDIRLTILVMGVVITVYTVVGGIEAVIYTDALQALLFIFTAVVTLIFLGIQLADVDFTTVAREGGDKFRWYIPVKDLKSIATVWLILETIFQTIRIYGTQQDLTQRYVTTKSTRDASMSVWIGALGYIPVAFAFYFIGVALFVFYYVNPDPALANIRQDAVYPHFIISQLPPGIGGLMLAGLFAAAMSSIDSLMNSTSTVCVEDFYKRFAGKGKSEKHMLLVARGLTLLWGVLAILMAFAFIDVEYAQWAWTKLMAVCTNGILGLMALAFVPFKVNKWAAIIGFVSCYVVMAALAYSGVNRLLWPVIGNISCFGIALAINAAIPQPPQADAAPASE